MDTQKFIDNFINIISTPKGLGELRKFILMLAVQGKLIEYNNIYDLSSKFVNSFQGQNRINPPYDLPLGWAWTILPEIGRVNPRNDYYDDTTEASFVPMSYIPEEYRGRLQFDIRFWGEIRKGYTHLMENDVAVAKITPCFENGKAVVMRGLKNGIGAGTTELHVFRGDPKIVIPDYVLMFFKNYKFQEDGKRKMTGSAGQLRVPKEHVTLTPFPLPPLSEQKLIVAKVEELMVLCDQLEKQQERDTKLRQKANLALVTKLIKSDVDKDLVATWDKYANNFANLLITESNIDTVVEMLKTLAVLGKLVENYSIEWDSQKIVRESLSAKMNLLSSKVITKRALLPPLSQDDISQSYPSRWSVATFEDLAYVSGGVTKGRKFKGRKTSNHPFLRVANVQRGYFLLDDIQEIEILVDEFEKYVLKDGDILITEGGDWDKVGRTAIWKNQIPACLHQNHVFKARLYIGEIKKEWIELVFNSSVGRDYWENASKQTTNLASINMTQVRSFPVPIPSMEEQELILDQLGKLLSICDELKSDIGKFT
jgi:type I restriction enzyme S subunit